MVQMKTFTKFLTEMPRMIKPLKNSKVKVSVVWEKIKANKNYTIIDEFPLNGYHLIEIDSQLLLIEPDWNNCTYYLNFQQTTIVGHHTVQQVYVWRDPSMGLPAFTYLVFWEILLKRFECIATDTTQTQLGKEFWLRRIPEAFNFGYSVARVNLRTKTVTPLTGMKDVYDSEPFIWGTTSKHENELVLICKGSIPGETNKHS
jgi:hypothetical protein